MGEYQYDSISHMLDTETPRIHSDIYPRSIVINFFKNILLDMYEICHGYEAILWDTTSVDGIHTGYG